MTARRAARPLQAVLLLAAACQGAACGAQQLKTTAWLQASVARQEYGPYLDQLPARQTTAELFLDLSASLGATELVLKPRARAIDSDPGVPGVPTARRFSLAEAYLNEDLGQDTRVTVGKRYLGWGVGLLYSPSNRLFPDNGSASPREEIDGKWMAMLGGRLGERLRTTLLVADPYVQAAPGGDHAGLFALARVESAARADGELTWAILAGGGGGYRPYAGSYVQTVLGGAWTLGAEWSASSGYARPTGSGAGLRADRAGWRADGVVTLRYGLASGGEWGIEYARNGFARADAERADPRLVLFPPAATTQTRYALRSPLPEKNYLNLQLNLTELFGDRRWALFARHLEAFAPRGRIDFIELAYSPNQRSTLYLGLSATAGNAASTLVGTLDRAAYLTAQIYL